jgi:hypothetical protein
MHLARLETTVLLTQILDHFERLELDAHDHAAGIVGVHARAPLSLRVRVASAATR